MTEIEKIDYLKVKRNKKKILIRSFLFLLVLFSLSVFGVYHWAIAPSEKYPEGQIINIPEGSSLTSVALILELNGAVKSADLFKIAAYLTDNQNDMKAGDYAFKQKENLFDIVTRIANADYKLDPVTVTIPEGWANYQIADRFAANLEKFDKEAFLTKAKDLEGYLYPDTYSFLPNANEDVVIKEMRDNFELKTRGLKFSFLASERTMEEIITMASLIESEAGVAGYETKQWVSGILWRRLEIGMPLQVDAVFSYINQEHIPQVLFSHLRIDSPYNTYKNTGMPPGPISNPDVDSIRAAIFPIDTGNLFYITGNDGIFYYAKTLDGHNENIVNHLRN